MRDLGRYYRRTLPEREVDVHEVERELDAELSERHRGRGLKAIVYDDRQRYMEEQRRSVQQQAASLAQEHLVIAHELMRLAGNGVWNSPVGFDRVLEEGVEGVGRATAELPRKTADLAAHASDYRRLNAEGVEDNIARSKRRKAAS